MRDLRCDDMQAHQSPENPNQKDYRLRNDVLYKAILRAVVKQYSNDFRDFVKLKMSYRDNPTLTKYYVRNLISRELFMELVTEYTSELLLNREVSILLKNIDIDTLEFYVALLVDRKLTRKYFNEFDQRQEAKRVYECIQNFTKIKFLALGKTSEINFILETLFTKSTVEKYKSGIKTLIELLASCR